MPNRVIKDSIKRSPQIDSLTWFEEVVFYRIIVTVDDYGCMDGRPILVKNELFPTKESITRKSIEDALHKLSSVGLIRTYEVDGIPYIHLPTWEKHQRIRNHKRKYPEPPSFDCRYEADNDLTATRGQLTADCGLNPIQSNPKPNPIQSETSRASAFDAWWKIYPKKVGKEAARKAFAKVKVPVETLISAVESQKSSEQWCKNNGQFIPNPTTWLNQGRWSDELHMKEGSSFQSNKIDANAGDEQARLEAMIAALSR